MESLTTGRVIYPDYQVKMHFGRNEEFRPETGLNDRYKVVLIKEGSGFLKAGNYRGVIMAPMLCCLTEKEALEFESPSLVEVISLYFHPCVINRKLDFDTMTAEFDTLSESDRQDRWCMRPFYTRDNPGKGIISIDPSVSKHIEGIMSRIGEELDLQKDESWPCRSRSYLIELMYMLCKIYDSSDTVQNTRLIGASGETDQIVMYLHMNYQNRITLNDLSKRFHTNKTTLNKQFKIVTGLTVMNYLNNLRIGIACSMLKNTSLSISELLNIVGFKDDAHFGRVFRKYAGCTPSQYRNSYQSPNIQF